MTLDEAEAWMRAQPTPFSPTQAEPIIRISFIDAPVRIAFDPATASAEAAIAALRNLFVRPPSFRDEIEPQVYAFYCKEIEDGAGNFDTPQEQLDWEAGFTKNFTNPRHATRPAEVWPLVRFSSLQFRGGEHALVASLWATAAWDGEHGCALHFDQGATLLGVTDLNEGPPSSTSP